VPNRPDAVVISGAVEAGLGKHGACDDREERQRLTGFAREESSGSGLFVSQQTLRRPMSVPRRRSRQGGGPQRKRTEMIAKT
jgi:hypothetical protein